MTIRKKFTYTQCRREIYMDLDALRKEIDDLDKLILDSFDKRMKLCRDVAMYKKENGMQIFQAGREQAIIKKVRDNSPEELKGASAALFTEIMDISKILQQQALLKDRSFIKPMPLDLDSGGKVACQGTCGSNSETAARKLFRNNEIIFVNEFRDVFKAVETGKAKFGMIPIYNSTAGSVTQNYDLIREHDVYIARTVKVEVTNCLAAKADTAPDDISMVYSHPQALKQCSEFLADGGFEPVESKNTASAAKFISECTEPYAAVCSENCAKLYGLKILKRGISNAARNFTRFICITKDFVLSDDAKTISVTLGIPNVKGSLYRLLTKFFVNDMNLEKIESRPIADGSCSNVRFFLDFEGNINDPKVKSLLVELADELDDLRFLGNYAEHH